MFARTRKLGLLLIPIVVASAQSADLKNKDAQQHFEEAESLRLAYEKEATLEAITKYAEAGDLWHRNGDYASAARAAERLGAAYEQLGALKETTESYTEALALAQKSGDRLLESELQSALGISQAFAGDAESAWRNAEMRCHRALTLALANGGDAEHANALNCLGEISYARGETAEALDLYGKAESIFRHGDNRQDLAQTLLFLGYAHSDLSSFQLAGANYDEALTIWRTIGDKRGTALTLVAIARMQRRQSQYQPALVQFNAARDFLEQMGDIVSLASSYDGIASVYMDLGQYQNARRFWGLALELFEEADLYDTVPYVLEELGLVELALGQPDRALTHLHRAHLFSKQSGNGLRQAYALRHLGYAHYSLGRPMEALAYLSQLLELETVTQFPRLEAAALNDIGSVYVSLGKHQKAISYLERALRLRRDASDRTGEARDLFGMATAYDGLGDLKTSRQYLEDALQVAESLRAEVVRQDMRASYVASVHEYYRLHVDLLMRTHQELPQAGFAELAFQASERARARSLLESLATAGVNLREGVDDRLLAEEEQLRRTLNDQYQRQVELSEDDGPAITQLADEIRDLETTYQEVKARIHVSSPRYAALTEPQPLTLRETQKQVLDDDTVLLEYALGEERSYLWVVSSDEFAVYALPPRAEIDNLARQTYSLLTQPSLGRTDDQHYWDTAARLSAFILGPAVDQIHGKRLVVVADGALQYVPFGALPTPGNENARPVPMIVEHEIVSLPSASTLAVLRDETRNRPKPARTLAVLADPVFAADDPRLVGRKHTAEPEGTSDDRANETSSRGLDSGMLTRDSVDVERQLTAYATARGDELPLGRLPHTANEADQITDAVPGGDFLKKVGFRANRASAISPELSKYRILHFATHAVFNESEPGLSGLILSRFDDEGRPQDGFVRLNDIYDLRLPAELVVLSACDTALGEEIEGEGLVGIVRGFMYAGSKRVVASLWQVADVATAELMTRFYVEMLAEGLTPADALRRAQLHMMDQRRWRHPYYWAAFTLQGEWRAD